MKQDRLQIRFFFSLAMSLGLAFSSVVFAASPQDILQKARQLLRDGNPKQAFVDLAAVQNQHAGTIEFDYLLGVAALDSGRNEDAVIAFERVLALNPNHAGAQLDLARAYYQTGAYELSEAGFVRLKAASPPADALAVINRYLDAIVAQKRKNTQSLSQHIELGLGRDSNITGVPVDFSAAVLSSFQLPGIEATGNSIRRAAPYFNLQGGLEYAKPIGRGVSLFVGGDGRARWYREQPDFRIVQGDVRGGASYNSGDSQARVALSYQAYRQEGAAPGTPKAKNDRDQIGLGGDWRLALSNRSQLLVGAQYSQIRFDSNPFEDFNQAMVSAGWMRSFEGATAPSVLLSGFYANDRAIRNLPDGETDKSKQVGGVRLYSQFSVTPSLMMFAQGGLMQRRDSSDFARAPTVAKGRDQLADAGVGVNWRFSKLCAMRTMVNLSRNNSNIAIFDYSRNEFSTSIRCDQ